MLRLWLRVASFTDAWIETWNAYLCGMLNNVASFTDAWIETIGANKRQKRAMSHLLQMRGLKLNNRRFDLECEESHLLQMRGLKPQKLSNDYKSFCRIFYRCVD